jgi:hypothetical protein
MTDRVPSDLATCSECGSKYSVGETLETSSMYFSPPYDYERGSSNHCLACWLGVGPRDFPSCYEGNEGMTERAGSTRPAV